MSREWTILVLVMGGTDYISAPNEGKDYTLYFFGDIVHANSMIIYIYYRSHP